MFRGPNERGTNLGQEPDRGRDSGSHGASEAALTTRIGDALAWARSHSLAPLPLSGGCCAALGIEAGVGPRHDLDEFGGGMTQHAARHADLLIVGGPITARRIEAIRRVHAEMATPNWVVAYGNCACSGGGYDNYATCPGLGSVLSVDIFIPGCPPRSEALLDGLYRLRRQIRGTG